MPTSFSLWDLSLSARLIIPGVSSFPMEQASQKCWLPTDQQCRHRTSPHALLAVSVLQCACTIAWCYCWGASSPKGLYSTYAAGGTLFSGKQWFWTLFGILCIVSISLHSPPPPLWWSHRTHFNSENAVALESHPRILDIFGVFCVHLIFLLLTQPVRMNW